MNNKLSIQLLLICWSFQHALAKDVLISSPDKKIKVTVSVADQLSYRVSYADETYLGSSAIGMLLSNGANLGVKPTLTSVKSQTVKRDIKPLYGITENITEWYNETIFQFKQNYAVVLRVYNEGLAYRFVTSFPEDLQVIAERNEFQFLDNHTAYFHPVLSESDYRVQKISDRKNKPNYSSLPVLVKTANGTNILIHESDVLNYPCLYIASDTINPNRLLGKHAAYPKRVQPGGYMNYNLEVKESEKYIAKTNGTRAFPWRIIAFAKEDKDILSNQLVYLLASESKLTDVSWIKPGKVIWDWWNATNLTGVPFKSGINTQTYRYFIDFAAANGIEYVNLDEGWSNSYDLLKLNPDVNVEEVVRYAKSKGVGIFLWCMWQALDQKMLPAMALFEKWGVAGLKVDFMDRDDQVVVEFQERILKEAARHRLLVNYHGAYHPTGIQRTYPNHINVEGVKGLEWNKFDTAGASPNHAVNLPFIRMFAGPMDYTPGALSNFNKKDWKQVMDRPMSQGTRCQQLAMYVVYYAPLQMLADAPTAYEKEPNILKFISGVPTNWDSVVPLENSIGNYVSVARRKGSNWYLGAITNWDARSLEIKLDFLEEGKKYTAEIFADGPNAERVSSDYILTKREVKKGELLKIAMAPGGGFAVKFTFK